MNYKPNEVPSDPADLPRFLREELDKIAGTCAALAAGHLDRLYVLPKKPRDGDVRYLDSTIAPGAVLGVYRYEGTSSTWKLLG